MIGLREIYVAEAGSEFTRRRVKDALPQWTSRNPQLAAQFVDKFSDALDDVTTGTMQLPSDEQQRRLVLGNVVGDAYRAHTDAGGDLAVTDREESELLDSMMGLLGGER